MRVRVWLLGPSRFDRSQVSVLGPRSQTALLRRISLPQGERPEDGGAEGLDHNQGLNRLMLAVRDMMATFHFHDLEAPHEDHAEGDGEWD